ncbi:MAG: hypothetical protein R6V01_08290 [Thermoplasmatota archaeon]
MKESVMQLEQEIKELYNDLREAYRCEIELESNNLWEKHLETEDDLRELLFRISYDSKAHRLFLENMFLKLRGFSYQKIAGVPFEFVGDIPKKSKEDLIGELRANEARVMEIYLNVYHGPSRDTIQRFWMDDDPEEFFKRVDWLVKQERIHDELIKKMLD